MYRFGGYTPLKLTSLIPKILTILYVYYPWQFSKGSLEGENGGFGSTHRTLEVFAYSVIAPIRLYQQNSGLASELADVNFTFN
jgi:hypothetical protein